ncbi:hypothetical protein S101446_03340 (plasmid) [Komagataeibacter europaeus]|nr:hypothetical protein S101446_03340 [Komagataeibacter europaeus]
MPNVALALDALGEIWRIRGGEDVIAMLDNDMTARTAWHAIFSGVAPHEWPDLVSSLDALIPYLRGRRDLLSPDSPFGRGVISESRRQALHRLLAPERIALLEAVTRPATRQEAA